MSKIGADPEVLLFSPAFGEYIPSIGLIGGTKKEPKPVLDGAIQEDGVAAEFNVNPVDLDDHELFANRIQGVRKVIDTLVKEHGLETRNEASAEFSEYMLDHPQAMASGCDPDMNVYTAEINKYPNPSTTNIRYAGGHIHFGDQELFQDPGSRELFIKYCDYYVGGPLSLLDKDTRRKKTYGAAGNFRYKSYGVEYRTPSNVWLQSTGTIYFVVQQLRKAKRALLSGDIRPLSYAEQVLSSSISDCRDAHTYSVLDIDTKRCIKQLTGGNTWE